MVQKREYNIPDHLMIHDWAFTDTHYIIFGNRIKVDPLGEFVYQILSSLLYPQKLVTLRACHTQPDLLIQVDRNRFESRTSFYYLLAKILINFAGKKCACVRAI